MRLIDRMLVEETLHMCAQYLTPACREEFEEHRAKTFHSLVLQGKLHTVVRRMKEPETGGVLQPVERCINTGERVMELLRTKHPEAFPPTADSLYSFPNHQLDLVPVDITDITVT